MAKLPDSTIANIFTFQPIASEDLLNLLYKSIEQAETSINTSMASLQDIQRNWN